MFVFFLFADSVRRTGTSASYVKVCFPLPLTFPSTANQMSYLRSMAFFRTQVYPISCFLPYSSTIRESHVDDITFTFYMCENYYNSTRFANRVLYETRANGTHNSHYFLTIWFTKRSWIKGLSRENEKKIIWSSIFYTVFQQRNIIPGYTILLYPFPI